MAALRVGDTVNVPGGMHGVLKFIGSVDGKKGTFAGVELADEYAARGKNSGDVDGKHYFRTLVPGGGIFLPVDKAEKRMSDSSATSSTKQPSLRTTSVSGSPAAPAVTRQTPRPSGMVRPSFSQSVGPSLQRVASPTALKPPMKGRDSLARPISPVRPRPSSPVRKTQTAPPVQTPAAAGRLQTPKTRPSVGLAKSTMGAPPTTGRKTPGLRAPSHVNGGPNKFSQSLRQSTSQTPRYRGAPSIAATSTPLGPDDRFDEDDTILEQNELDTTPTPTPQTRGMEKAASANAERLAQENHRLRELLEERDRLSGEQANSITEMERSLAELQNMMPNGPIQEDESDLPRDVQSLRMQLRDKNEKVKALMAEFDANRADFRSTIDTLEMASTETERVYEQRVEDLLQQVQQLQERNEDVDSVAQQFKQLEELVQELEEGLEESRRAEAEARSEVEFLRGEVERSKSELRREKERSAAHAALEGGSDHGGGISSEEYDELQATLTRKDDEIRGLKTIIQSLQGTAAPDRSSYGPPTVPKANGANHLKNKSTATIVSPEGRASSETLQQQISDLETLLQEKSSHEEKLENEVRELRQSMNVSNKWSFPGGTAGALGLGHRKTESQNDKHNSGGSQRTIVGQVSTPYSPVSNSHQRKDSTIPDMADTSSDTAGSPLKDEFGIDTADSEEANEDRRRRSAEIHPIFQPVAPPSISERSNAAQWCEICEEPGHDILNCANMIGSSTHRDPSPQPEVRTGKDAGREGLRRSNENHLLDQPGPLRKAGTYDRVGAPPSAPLPPRPGRSGSLAAHSNGGGSNRSSATPANSTQTPSSTTVTPTKPTLIEGTGDQAGMLGGKISGVIDPEKWCALCERDGHDSVDCPVEDAF